MRKILLALLFLAFALPAAAQQQYGRLEGAARDAQGLALPGVSVSLTGEAIIGGRNATTDIDGSYRFQALPPGDYNIQFELSGFQTVVFEAVRVVTGATFTVDANMQIATVAETVTVTGESPVVDVKSTGVAATFDKTQLDEVPTATDMWAVLHQSPGIRVQGYDVGGSHKSQQSMYETFGVRSQNRVLYEGVNTTEGTGSAGGYYDYYAMEEMQVSAQGADVEMSTPGAQIQTTVKSGGNDFSGLQSGAWNPPDLIADNFNSELEAQGGSPSPVLSFYEFHLDLGGPIVRDKAWFYGAYNNFYIDTAISGVDQNLATDIGDFDIFTAKVNYQITERDQFIGFSTWSWKRKPNRGLSATRPAESILAQDYWIWLHKAEWQRVWSDRFFSNIMVGHMGTTWPMVPKDDPINGNEPRFNLASSHVSGAGWQPFTRNRWKPQSTAQFNYYVPIGNGSHDFKFGWDWQIDSELRGFNTNSGGIRYRDDPGQGRPLNVHQVDLVGVPNLVENRNMHADFFVQDVWTVNDRLTLMAGVRVGSQILYYLEADNSPGSACQDVLQCKFELPAHQGQILMNVFGAGGVTPGADVFDHWNVAPRVGLTYDITGEGSSVFKTYFGRYYSNIGTGLLSANPGGQPSARYEFLDQNMNGVLDDVSELGQQLSFTAGAGSGSTTPIDPNWTLPWADELSASVEHELTADLGARVSYVYKRMRNTWSSYDQADLGLNTPITIPTCDGCPAGYNRSFNLLLYPEELVGTTDRLTTNHPAGESDMDFHTVSLGLNKRFRSNFFYNVYFDYQWRSEPRSAAGSSSGWATSSPLSSDPTSQGWFINYDQDIPTVQDTTTYQLKASARYVLPYEIGVAGTYRLVSGYNYAPTHRNTVYDGRVTVTSWLAPMNEARSPNVTIVDFRLDKSFALSDRMNAQFIFDIFNAMNANTIVNFQLLDSVVPYQNIVEYLKGRTIGLSARLTF
ncbi:MAG: TonB-dependent receptor [Acidobacteria bacterium]|nr:TonB-dependent receptor [Acidobacteriota bacterium]